ncbi:MAG: hypothetical protein QOH21_2989, partial [Acidobacteriota bacterium]|nr:hypothetical protein [Acidobacteriota bacterium]
MGHSSGRSRAVNRLVAPLLFLIALAWQAAAAPPPTEEAAYRDARSMIDRGDLAGVMKKADAALAVPGRHDPQWTCAWQMLRAEIMVQGKGGADNAKAIVDAPLPSACVTSEAEVRRLQIRAYLAKMAREDDKAESTINAALALAEKYHPKIVAELILATASVGNERAGESNARKAVALARKQKNKAVEAKALATLSATLIGKAQYAEGISYGEQALAMSQQLGLKTNAARAQANLAWALVDIGDYERAAA